MRLRASRLLVAIATVSCSMLSPSQDAEFVALADSYIEELLERYPEFATALGDHRHDGRLNDYSAQGVADGIAWNRRHLESLETIDPSRLSPANAVDFEILKNELRYSIWSGEELREHVWNPMRYGVGDALYSLLAREFAPLEDRLASLKWRLEAVSAVFDAARANLANPPRIHTETAIRQNDGVISLVRDELDGFLAEAPGMEEELASARESAIEALEEHGRWLREDLLPRSKGDFRLGEEKYRTKLAFTLHSDLSMEEILSRAERRLAELQDELYETALPLYRELPAGATDPNDRMAAIRAVLDSLADSHPTDTSIVEDARRSLEEVTSFTKDNALVTVPDEPLQIIVMPEFRRGVSTAYCDSPGPLEKNGETFYAISPTPEDWTPERKLSFYREYNDFMLQDLTIHEAIPGHYLQIAHSNRVRAPTMIRSVFYSGSFVEGWAVYAEQVMVEHGYGGARFKMQQLKMLTRAVINAILDQKIHAGSMTEGEAMGMMLQEGFQEDGEAAGKWIRAQLTSAQLSSYFVGIAEHNDIRQAWVERNGPIEDWRAYHDMALSYGSPPAKFVRGLLGL
jgi:uncharacterized protein (DUF885 family)